MNANGELAPRYEILCRDMNRHDENDYKNMERYAEKLGVRTVFENTDFLLITYLYKKAFTYLFVDKQTWTLSNVTDKKSEPGFEDDLKNGPTFTPVPNNGSEQNRLVSIVYQDRFPALKHCLGKEIKEDDNPVVVIADLK
jgi:hypothetical protein